MTQAYLDQIAATDQRYSAFLHVAGDAALSAAAAVDKALAAGEQPAFAAGRGAAGPQRRVHQRRHAHYLRVKFLEVWRPLRRHRDRAAARGRNPDPGQDQYGRVRDGLVDGNSATARPATRGIPTGARRSGGGSAAALAAFQAPLAIGTDTGGSIRQPAALTATVGVKPTYGTVSRYGLVACASSLDQGGPCARTVLDTALLHQVIAGHDPGLHLAQRRVPDVVGAAKAGAAGDLSGVRVGVVRECASRATSPACWHRSTAPSSS